MSYDLMVFSKKKRFKKYEKFIKWYYEVTEWDEDYLDHNDYRHAIPELQQWFLAMKDIVPPLNGEFAPSSEELGKGEFQEADYCIGREAIYVAFSLSDAEKAYQLVKEKAREFDLAFFDISGDGGVIYPDGEELTINVNDKISRFKKKIRFWKIVCYISVLPLCTGIGYALGLLNRDSLNMSQILFLVIIVLLAVLWWMLDKQLKHWEKDSDMLKWHQIESKIKYPASFNSVEPGGFLESLQYKRIINAYLAFHDRIGDTYYYVHYKNNKAVKIVVEQEGSYSELAEDECDEFLTGMLGSVKGSVEFDMIGTISRSEFIQFLEHTY